MLISPDSLTTNMSGEVTSAKISVTVSTVSSSNSGLCWSGRCTSGRYSLFIFLTTLLPNFAAWYSAGPPYSILLHPVAALLGMLFHVLPHPHSHAPLLLVRAGEGHHLQQVVSCLGETFLCLMKLHPAQGAQVSLVPAGGAEDVPVAAAWYWGGPHHV